MEGSWLWEAEVCRKVTINCQNLHRKKVQHMQGTVGTSHVVPVTLTNLNCPIEFYYVNALLY